MAMTRREFLRRAGIIGATLPVASAMIGCVDNPELESVALPDYEYDGPLGPEDLFQHSVASGDPTEASVIIWTRVTPEDEPSEVDVYWEFARDPDFEERIDAGYVTTGPTRDYTVKVDAFGLLPASTYYYRFQSQGRMSPVGRTRTAPAGAYEHARFAVVSCSNYQRGLFHIYADIAAREDLDFVMHLGDYIYEGGANTPDPEFPDLAGRINEPATEIISLSDYRTRYSLYRRDPDLQEVHRQHPFIVVWDDHESANNSWENGAQNHQEETEGPWSERKADSIQAYFEWLPIREQEQPGQIWRKLSYGDLFDVIMLDTRLWGRDEAVRATDSLDPDRTILGFDQEAWLEQELAASNATWKVVGQQVMMAQLKGRGLPNSEGGGTYLNGDQWDGYAASRFRFFDLLRERDVDNVIVLTGDIHTSWASDLTPDPNNPDAYDPGSGDGSLAVEFVCTSVTSPGLPFLPPGVIDNLKVANPHIKYIDLLRRGYVVIDLKPDRAQGAYFHVDTIFEREHEVTFSAALSTDAGANRLRFDDEPAEGKADPPALAP